MLYKGYIKCNGKRAAERFKDRTDFKSLDEVKDCDGYGGVLADDVVLIDIDDGHQAEILLEIVRDQRLKCRVYRTNRGKHFLFKGHEIQKNRQHTMLAMGLTADIKTGSRTSYQVIKINGEERPIEYDSEEYGPLPKWMYPVKTSVDFIDLQPGDGRNQTLFNYELTLTAHDFTVDEARQTIRIINKYIFPEPLADEELEVILRDEAFDTPVFFNNGKFLFNEFATFLKNHNYVIRINGQLHIYDNGVYVSGNEPIEKAMIRIIPYLKRFQRKEVLDCLKLITEERHPADARYIGFKNGILDIVTEKMLPHSPDLILTNKIPWNYRIDAYHKLTDRTLDRLSCGDVDIRMLLEECIGYCFYRRNELGKAFILTGDKANGKSTFLDMIKAVLGDQNISVLDLKELGDRFSTAMIFGKLANIGDDISDDFLLGGQVAIVKKIITGNRIKAENKGQDPFEFNPYVKLLFSANDIPRMRDKTGAVLRRLVIIPFNARFQKYLPDGTLDPEYDPYIKYKLIEQSSMEYLIRLGVKGLRRVIEENEFSKSDKVQKRLEDYEKENNPIIGFIEESGKDMIINEVTDDVYRRYTIYCAENGFTPLSKIPFVKDINKRLGTISKVTKINKKPYRIFCRY